MNTETLTKEKMDSMKSLADMSIKISEAQISFDKLKNTETEYLTKRENKAQLQINKILEDSEEVLKKAHSNYEETNVLYTTVVNYAHILDETYEKFKKMLEDFNKRNEMWDKKIELQTHKLSDLEKKLAQEFYLFVVGPYFLL